jgi:hypothetical protein
LWGGDAAHRACWNGKNPKHLRDAVDPHFKFAVSGRTKGNQMSSHKFAIPCVNETDGIHLKPGIWVERLVVTLREMGIRRGRLFAHQLLPSKLLEFEEDLFKILEKVQATTTFIAKGMDVRSEYGIGRSNRRGVTAHARNMEVGREIISAINRWHEEANSSTGDPRMDMADIYTTLDALIPSVLRYSRAL